MKSRTLDLPASETRLNEQLFYKSMIGLSCQMYSTAVHINFTSISYFIAQEEQFSRTVKGYIQQCLQY